MDLVGPVSAETQIQRTDYKVYRQEFGLCMERWDLVSQPSVVQKRSTVLCFIIRYAFPNIKFRK